MDVAEWLSSLGLEQYEPAFRANEIDARVLLHLTAEDLKELGVALVGHRRLLLEAIAALGAEASVPPDLPAQVEAERRQLTVMFCDLVGSTALSTRLDPEDLSVVIGAYHRCSAALIERGGGFVARYMGDGVLAYFGYPRADENDPERAVRTGLQLVEAVAELDTAGAPLQVRVGIATGLVVVGDLIGQGTAREQAVVGETPNLAARLQALAEPGAVVIAPSTRRLTGGLFDYEDLGAVEIKGFAAPVMAVRVLRESTVEGRFAALRTAATPLVGRNEELAVLQRLWCKAKGVEGSTVLVSGEPGIGKSRLAQTLLEQLSGEPHTRLRLFCSPHHQDHALYPTITQLERAAGFRREHSADERLDKLEALLNQATSDFAEAAPLIADLLSLPTGDRYPPVNLTSQKQKEATLRALLTQVEGLSAQQPVLMLFEDAQWSDPTSLELLDLIIDRVPTLQALLMITFRPEFAPPWAGRPHVTSLALNRLTPQQRVEVIGHVAGGKPLPREIAEQIVDRTDGVPLFIEELTKAVIESGLVADVGDHYAASTPAPTLAIPTSLHASLLARLDRLAPPREVAQIGAALGRSFSHELIGAVAPMPRHTLDDALEELVRAELVFRRGTPPDAEYTFKHALVQDAAYSTLLRSRRRQLHGRIAATFEKEFPETAAAQPELLAHHFSEAGLAGRAAEYCLKAGQQAVARSAMTEAVAQLQKGLELLRGLPDDARRRRQELDLQLALIPALIATRGYAAPEVGGAITRARGLAEQLDRSDYLIGLLYGQCFYHIVRSEYHLAHPVAERMEQIGETRNDRAMLLLGHYVHGHIRLPQGEFVAARALFEQCDGLRDPAHRAIYTGLAAEDPHTGMLIALVVTLANLGHLDQAQHLLDAALTEARRLEHAYTLCYVLGCGSWAQWPAGSTKTAQRLVRELLAVAEEQGFRFWTGWGAVHDGWSATALGRAQEGLALLMKGLAILRSTANLHSLPWLMILVADAHARLGQTSEGLDCLTEAARLIDMTGERCAEAELHRVRGDLLHAGGDRTAPEENYLRALAVARRQSAKTLELRAALSLARLWRDQDRRTEAHGLLAPIYGWFTEGFDTPVLQDAEILLNELK
jgi:class 3 adenylate cyclase/tetratricopeptide (TPR) repeat protein